MAQIDRFPPLPLDAWEDTKITLHLFSQIVGKVRMALHPKLNHWWHVTLYPSPRGLTTGRIPLADRDLTIDLDLRAHRVILTDSEDLSDRFDLVGLSVAQFHRRFF